MSAILQKNWPGRILFSLVAASLCGAGCSDLPRISRDLCGNGVVETGEDCDMFAKSSQLCRAPGDLAECHFDCTKSENGAASCPTGWSCGTDGVCREASGSFSPGKSYSAIDGHLLYLADFDNDGKKEVISAAATNAIGQSRIRFLSFDSSGQPVEKSRFGAPVGTPTVAKLGRDEFDDLSFSTTFGIGVLRGDSDGLLRPVPYSFADLPPGMQVSFLPIRGWSGSPLGQLVVALVSFQGNNFLSPVTNMGEVIGQTPGPVASLATEPLAIDLVQGADSPCEELVLAYSGDPKVYRVELCNSQGLLDSKAYKLSPLTTLASQNATARSLFGVDLNNDGLSDLLVGMSDGSTEASFACGVGQMCARSGDLSTEGKTVPVSFAPSSECTGSVFPQAAPLAVGDVDQDGMPDFVFPYFGLLSSELSPSPDSLKILGCPAFVKSVGEWSLAVLEDINRDGMTDVIEASASSLDLEVFLSTGKKRLNPSTMAVRGPITRIATGDFDGDLVSDIAVCQKVSNDQAASGQSELLSIAYGRASGWPEVPVDVADFARIFVAGAADFETSDALQELGVVAQSIDGSHLNISVLFNQSERQPYAPFGLFAEDPDVQDSLAIALSVGHFLQGDNKGLAVYSIGGTCAELKDCPGRLWFMPVSGEAQLTSRVYGAKVQSEFTPIVDSPSPAVQLALVAADADNDGRDELLLLTPYAGASGSALWQAKMREDGSAWEDSGRPTLLATMDRPFSREPLPTAVDVDRDGSMDLVFATGSGDVDRAIWVAYNDGKGGLDLGKATRLGEAIESARYYAFSGLPSLGTSRMYLLSKTGLSQLDWGQDRRLEIRAVENLGGGRAIVTGDVTGDGIEDLVVGSDSAISVYPGKPVVR